MNCMLSEYGCPQFLSRVFTDVSGRRFRLTFFAAVVDGEVRGRLVSAEPVSASVARLNGTANDASSGPIFFLPIAASAEKPATEYVSPFAPKVSPYFSAFELLIHSQPTRAPSFA